MRSREECIACLAKQSRRCLNAPCALWRRRKNAIAKACGQARARKIMPHLAWIVHIQFAQATLAKRASIVGTKSAGAGKMRPQNFGPSA